MTQTFVSTASLNIDHDGRCPAVWTLFVFSKALFAPRTTCRIAMSGWYRNRLQWTRAVCLPQKMDEGCACCSPSFNQEVKQVLSNFLLIAFQFLNETPNQNLICSTPDLKRSSVPLKQNGKRFGLSLSPFFRPEIYLWRIKRARPWDSEVIITFKKANQPITHT